VKRLLILKNMKNHKGFAALSVLIAIVLGLIVIGGGAYFVTHQNSTPQVSQNYPDVSTQQQPRTVQVAQTADTPVSTNSSIPTCTFTATPTYISVGQTYTLTWTSKNATAASIMEEGTPGPAKVLLNGATNPATIGTPETLNFTLTVSGKGGTNTCSTSVTAEASQSKLTASPLSGSAPLTVTFNGVLSTSNPSASGGLGVDEPYITFGENEQSGDPVFCANTPSDTTNYVYPTSCTFSSVNHTYTSPGTYTAVLHLGEQKGTQTTLGTVTITVQ
jgi:hypothetical protein